MKRTQILRLLSVGRHQSFERIDGDSGSCRVSVIPATPISRPDLLVGELVVQENTRSY
jgi:hypothetical protein